VPKPVYVYKDVSQAYQRKSLPGLRVLSFFCYSLPLSLYIVKLLGAALQKVRLVRGSSVKNKFYIAAILYIAMSMRFPLGTVATQPQSAQGDGIFTPRISPVAAIDKTNRPMTVELPHPEPSFAALMVQGKPTGDSYIINFSTGSAGGACVYSGTGRYLIESTGTLTFQILADCGKLRRAYSYMICSLDESLRCSEPPWWYFKDRTFVVTTQGVAVNGSTVYPWKDTSLAPEQLQAMAANIKSMKDRFRNDPHVVHSRLISCRSFHPSTRSYEIHEIATTCLVKSLCDGIPKVDSLHDGDRIDWNSPVGSYVKQENKISDVSTWVCWIRTQ